MMALEDVLLRQCVGVAVVQVVGPRLQAVLQLAVGPGKRAGTLAGDGTPEAQISDQHYPSGLPSPCTLLLEGEVLLPHTC